MQNFERRQEPKRLGKGLPSLDQTTVDRAVNARIAQQKRSLGQTSYGAENGAGKAHLGGKGPQLQPTLPMRAGCCDENLQHARLCQARRWRAREGGLVR